MQLEINAKGYTAHTSHTSEIKNLITEIYSLIGNVLACELTITAIGHPIHTIRAKHLFALLTAKTVTFLLVCLAISGL